MTDYEPTTSGVTVVEGPSQDEWSSIKGIFIELYVHQEKKLSEIKQILADQYDFHATEKAFKRRIATWGAFKNYKSTEKEAVVHLITQSTSTTTHGVVPPPPPVQLHGKPIKWDRIRRFSRPQGQGRKRTQRKTTGVPPIGEKIHLDLHPNAFRSTVDIDERILLLTKSYLDWNVSFWSPLGLANRRRRRQQQQQEQQNDHEVASLDYQSGGDSVSLLFNKCFYDAIPLLLTGDTVGAFREINLACSLASHCFQTSPYWIFLRLLRLYSYPLWDRFPDVRAQIVHFLQALAFRTLSEGHVLKPLLKLWTQGEIDANAGRIASILRLSSDKFGPASGLDVDEWAWIQDEICSLNYQRKEFDDALRIARRLAQDPSVPLGVHIAALQMIARQYLQNDDVAAAEPVLLETLRLCQESGYDDDFKARFLQQTFSDMGYMYGARRDADRAKSAHYYQQALAKAAQAQNPANMASIRCRIEAMAKLHAHDKAGNKAQAQAQQDTTSWALWAFCRPYS
ncbi:uncharacterized protein Z520_05060 [Fonsecaea multimorphosa CBS 102226]|uniref:Clr5 domain-containing protein n=1 Tax=Fonsecaea multimorphosa CBS 102226 TaxID=1442371 RepID=A0A0D2K8K1_9EURO|nr:uncharacterized protein Z520_05060 [Fonsecaea multimorphosa CBS 102226]KIX99484.1 hypothetical protein Z520_05060 [Fonsecaea multimorphosa CBS 102226]OAL25479.1 hypothetical protein AYO22_04798 [Fonsecaea multimorphosa]